MSILEYSFLIIMSTALKVISWFLLEKNTLIINPVTVENLQKNHLNLI